MAERCPNCGEIDGYWDCEYWSCSECGEETHATEFGYKLSGYSEED